MKNVKDIMKGVLVLPLLAGVLMASPASAQSPNANANAFQNAQASLKAEALVKLESATAVVLGPNGALRVMGAKVASVTDNAIKATVSFGETLLNFVVNVGDETRLNGNKSTSTGELEAGDKISFAGVIDSSSSSSITVDADHIVSRALLPDNAEEKSFWRGEVKTVGSNSLTVELPSGREVKVSVSSSTEVSLDGSSSSLSSLDEGDEVAISGKLDSAGKIISATKITAKSDDVDEDKDEKPEKENRGWFLKVRNWFGGRN